MSDIQALISGFRDYQREVIDSDRSEYRHISDHGPHAKIMIIACCDSRVDPAIITQSKAGDVMVVRNMANLVPPYASDSSFQETQAAIEFACCYLQVEHIIVMGHSRCAGIRSLMVRLVDELDSNQPLDRWMEIAEPAARMLLAEPTDADLDQQCCSLGRRALNSSLKNLEQYPWVADALQQDRLSLHGWYFDIAEGELESLDVETGEFKSVYHD